MLGDSATYLPEENAEGEEKEDEARFATEWRDNMLDFVPSDMVTFELAARGTEEFYEMIEIVPSKVRGAFFVSSKETKDLDMTITAPDDSVMYEALKQKEGIFVFDASQHGQYSFRFNNRKFVEKLQITLALHTGNSSDTPLDKTHITPVEGGLLEIVRGIKDFQMEQQFAQLRQESHYKTVENANRNLFWFSLLECLGVIGVTTWQVYYIKKIMDHRRMI